MKIRNILKKTLAVVLAFAMMAPIAGNLEANVKKVKAASTEDSLNIKCQVTQGVVTQTEKPQYEGKYVMRFVSAVNNYKDYKEIGFKLVEEGQQGEKTAVVQKVFKRIESTTGIASDGTTETEETYNYSPKVINTDGEYFITAKLPIDEGEKDTKYTVWAYGIKKDDTRVTGPARCISVKDGLEKNGTGKINMSFQNTSAIVVKEGDTLKANDLDATVIGVTDDTVHVRITKPTSALPSATLFEFKTQDGQTTVGKEVFRYLNTKYTGNASADKTWYTAYMQATNNEETAFTIATSADLYGFAALVDNGNYFENKEVYLVSDIAVNDDILVTDTESNDFKKWLDATTNVPKVAPTNVWNPIGNSSVNAFNGEFNGQGHTISGIYSKLNETASANRNGNGFFCALGSSAWVRNFKLTNSYFTYTTRRVGSIAGTGRGTIRNVYSDAIVVGSKEFIGGFVGRSERLNLQRCWFDGVIESKTGTTYYGKGGFIGCVDGYLAIISNCLNTGTLDLGQDTSYNSAGDKSQAPKAGGFVGYINYTDSLDITVSAGTVKIENSLNAGKVLVADDDTFTFGRLVGWRQSSATLEVIDSYTTVESLVQNNENPAEDVALNNVSSAKPNMVSEQNILGTAAKDAMQEFDWNVWQCGKDGKLPSINLLAEFEADAAPEEP